jgi:transposase
MMTYGIVLFHDNARPQSAALTRTLLEHFDWELFDHPPYSPDLGPRDYYLFVYLSEELAEITAPQQ